MIVFENEGEIDVRSISTFGVSVKEGDSPIGFFGTGLKYAIAVLLRTGHKVHIHSGLSQFRFGLKKDSVRGQEFDFITMQTDDAEPQVLGFTTELGKQWDVWMAYREIACNCKDEGGKIDSRWTKPNPVSGVTHVMVKGDAFADAYNKRLDYILEDAPTKRVGSIEVRDRDTYSLFYRGVRVMQLPRKALYTYNFTEKLVLTEDRTVKDQWEIGRRFAEGIRASNDRAYLREVLTAPDTTYEGGLDLDWSYPMSPEFLQVCGEIAIDRPGSLNKSAYKVWKDAAKAEFSPKEIDLTRVQVEMVRRAVEFCASIGFKVDKYPILFVESLGDGILGQAKDETIYIAERTLHLGGTKQLASTLIEEYLHLRHGWADMTRELQSFLFDKIVSLGEELQGKPL